MSKVLMIFIDGVGIGENDKVKNPFFKYNFRLFSDHFSSPPDLSQQYQNVDNSFFWPSDACMGIEGLPQSGTGQTSIFCGVNAQKIIGKHFGPYPYSTLIPVIRELNIFKTLQDAGRKVLFVNAYPKIFFDYLKSGKQRLSFTTLSCKLNGMRLNTASDLRKGRALSAEINNSRWREKLGYNLPVIRESTAALRLIRLAAKNDFTLFEYFLTDHFGHLRHGEYFEEGIRVFDHFLYEIFERLPDDMTLFVCSDHGNFEDMSVKTHTLNPALCMASGKYAKYFSENVANLEQIKPALLKVIS